MDGYEFERKILWPAWNKEIKSNNASSSSQNMKDRLKDELGIQIPKDPIEIQMNLSSKIVRNPDNFYPELSPDYELMKSTRKSRWG